MSKNGRITMVENKKQKDSRGLILIQIDGLARFHLKRALDTGRLPFLTKLLNDRGYRIHPLYSGLPSATPAVQGELFYGVKSIVPAFSFRDHQSGKIFRMYDPDAAVEIENRLQRQDSGLLEGGSAYAGIFSGGSQLYHFCTVSFGKNRFFRNLHPTNIPIAVSAYLKTLVKSLFLMGVEAGLGLVDFFRGISTGKNFLKELKFIASRIAVTILLRDLVKTSAVLDTKSGVPVIYLNFLGYDEHAHRRGPSSGFAYWTLKGIDAAIREIWKAARRSKQKAYDIWVYSDHGQEGTISYRFETGRSIQEAVSAVLTKHVTLTSQKDTSSSDHRGVQSLRSSLLGGRLLPKLFVRLNHSHIKTDEPMITAMGPLGHIYLPRQPDAEEKRHLGRMLVEKAAIPLVLAVDGSGRVIAWNQSGEFILPDQAADIIGRDHPYRQAVTDDLITLCRHRDVGVFIISGWRPHAKPLSFPVERGSHGGPGRQETDAFALLPPNATVMVDGDHNRDFLRIGDLRQAAISFLKGSHSA
jgi:hypothetical protein